MIAVIRDRGKQYKVAEGDVLEIDLLAGAQDGAKVEFSDVLLTSDGTKVQVGAPTVGGASVAATVVDAEHKGKKIDVVHFRRRKDSMTKTGHRAKYTHVKIDKINAGA
ncbi:MAG: 50S ribosomal protein L21 [Planctomycetota bacterium]